MEEKRFEALTLNQVKDKIDDWFDNHTPEEVADALEQADMPTYSVPMLYRGLTKDNQWVFGAFAEINGRHFITKPIGELASDAFTNKMSIVFEIVAEIQPGTADRFTGRKDRAGNDIYENDIVSGFDYSDFYTGIDSDVNARVVWKDDDVIGFLYDAEAVYMRHMRAGDEKYVLVIGNYHQNPGLMNSDTES